MPDCNENCDSLLTVNHIPEIELIPACSCLPDMITQAHFLLQCLFRDLINDFQNIRGINLMHQPIHSFEIMKLVLRCQIMISVCVDHLELISYVIASSCYYPYNLPPLIKRCC